MSSPKRSASSERVPSSGQRDEHGAARAPTGTTCSQPRPFSEPLIQTMALPVSFDVADGQQPVLDVGEHRRDADADQDQPVAVEPAPPGQRVDGQRADQAADQGQRGMPRAGSPLAPPYALPRPTTATTAAPEPPGDAEDLGAGQRVAGDGLDDRAGQRERRADQRRRSARGAGGAP